MCMYGCIRVCVCERLHAHRVFTCLLQCSHAICTVPLFIVVGVTSRICILCLPVVTVFFCIYLLYFLCRLFHILLLCISISVSVSVCICITLYFCPSLSVIVSVSVYLCLCLCLSICICLSVSVSVPVCLCVSILVSVFVATSILPLSIYRCLCIFLSLFRTLSLFSIFCSFFSITHLLAIFFHLPSCNFITIWRFCIFCICSVIVIVRCRLVAFLVPLSLVVFGSSSLVLSL
mmetsp:Transcript_5627/g.8357  ORF Transcript_5627/g.8357 Transcript_5627/m.8357 type:complete len:233 (-) Transcript_5627:88-786(-)